MVSGVNGQRMAEFLPAAGEAGRCCRAKVLEIK
jgi:hypothetical protein